MIGDDRTPFFNTDHFAKAATYTPVSGVATTVNGIFDKEFIDVNGHEAYSPVFICDEDDITGTARGGTLAIDGVTYTIRGTEPDGTGIMMLKLEAP